MKLSAMKNAVLYCRVSTDDQAENGVSLADQESRLRSYCVAMGYQVLDVLVDAGISGSTEPRQRPGLGRIDTDIHLDAATHLIAVDLSRFSRDTRHTLDLVEFLEKHDIALVSLAESLDTKSPSGRLVVTVLAAMNQFQRENIAAKTKSALSHLKATGRRYGNIPYGFRSTEAGNLVADDGEQKVLDFVDHHMRVDGQPGASVMLEQARLIGLVNPRTGLVVNYGCLSRLRGAWFESNETGGKS